MILKGFRLLAFLVLLSGCVSQEERDARDNSRCLQMGASQGSLPYFQCRQMLSLERQQNFEKSMMMFQQTQQILAPQGGQNYSNSYGPYTKTYNYNGRIVTCTTTGQITNCY
jgi:hypothetical protein